MPGENSTSGEKDKAAVYLERNLAAVALVDAVDVPSGYYFESESRTGMPVVWADLPTGQVSWHVQRWMIPDTLPERDPEYDGYSDEEKNRRVASHLGIEEGFSTSPLVRFNHLSD